VNLASRMVMSLLYCGLISPSLAGAPLASTPRYEMPIPDGFDRSSENNHGLKTDGASKCGSFNQKPFYCSSLPAISTETFGNWGVTGMAPFPAPLPIVTDHALRPLKTGALETKSGLETPHYGWARIGDVIDGPDILRAWTAKADSQEVFGCQEGVCSMIVRSWGRNNEVALTGLCVCRIFLVNGQPSSPTKCEYVALVQEEGQHQTWLKALVRYYDTAYAEAGRIDFLLAFPPKYFDIQKYLSIVRDNLAKGPLHADTEIQAGKSKLIATSNYKFLPEIALFCIYTIVIDKEGFTSTPDSNPSSKPSYLNMEPVVGVATTLYVSARTADASNEWRMPSPAVNSEFLKLVYSATSNAALKMCPGANVDGGGEQFFHFVSCK
jgi:hypothetical protein